LLATHKCITFVYKLVKSSTGAVYNEFSIFKKYKAIDQFFYEV